MVALAAQGPGALDCGGGGLGFETSFNTNGWLVTEKRAQSLVDAGVSTVYVSLDGLDRKEVDRSRGRRLLRQGLEAIEPSAAGAPNVITAAISTPATLNSFSIGSIGLRPMGTSWRAAAVPKLWPNRVQPRLVKTSEMWPHKAEQVKQLHDVLDELDFRPGCGVGRFASSGPAPSDEGNFIDPTRIRECPAEPDTAISPLIRHAIFAPAIPRAHWTHTSPFR